MNIKTSIYDYIKNQDKQLTNIINDNLNPLFQIYNNDSLKFLNKLMVSKQLTETDNSKTSKTSINISGTNDTMIKEIIHDSLIDYDIKISRPEIIMMSIHEFIKNN